MGSKEHKSRKRKASVSEKVEVNKKCREVNENNGKNTKVQSEEVKIPPEQINLETGDSVMQSGHPPVDYHPIEEDQEASDEPIEKLADEKEITFGKNLDIREFRKRLQGDNFIYELRHFIQTCQKGKRDIVADFLSKKGRPMELIEAFQRIDFSSLHQVYYLAEVFRIVLERIVNDYPDEREKNAQSCRFFLKTCNKVLQLLIKSPNVNHRQTCIGLLTVLSSLLPEMIRQIFACFDEFRNRTMMQEFLSHSKHDNGSGTVRETFVQFILSLLINGSTFVIRTLLDKYELIAICIQDLIYDDHETVISVLTAFKKCVLESLLISKTKKLRVFDREMIKSLINLYAWRGPAYFVAQSQKNPGALTNYIDEKKRDLVQQCLTDFLVLLLSNRKYGIAFDTMRFYGERKNEIQKRVLPMITDPWKSEYKSRLVIEILQACPELVTGLMRNFTNQLRGTNKSDTLEMTKFLNFISTVVDSMSPKVMRVALDEITLTHITHWIKELCLPSTVLYFLKTNGYLKSRDVDRRLATARTLLSLYRQYCNYMTVIIEREKFKGNDLRKFRFEMLEHLLLNFPTVEDILIALFMDIEMDEKHQKMDEEQKLIEKKRLDHMEATFDLLMYICKANRSFVNKTVVIIDYIKMLYPFFNEVDDQQSLTVKLKGMKLVLLLDPKYIKSTEQSFNNVVENLSIIYNRDKSDSLNVRPLLQKLLLNSHVFDNGPLEVDIWLEMMKFFDDKSMKEIAKCWKVLAKEKIDMSEYRKIDFTSKSNLKGLFQDIENDISVEGYMDIPVMSKCLIIMLSVAENWPKCREYFELVAFFMFHFIPAPEAIQKVYSENYSTHSKYMKAWLEKGSPGKLKLSTIPRLSEMYTAILDGQVNFAQVFAGEVKFKIDENELNLIPELQRESFIMLLIYPICFVVSQLAEKNSLERNQVDAASHYLINLLELLRQTKSHETDDVISLDTNTKEEVTLPYIEQALRYFYCRHLPLLRNFNVFGHPNSDAAFIQFICNVTDALNKFKIDQWDYLTTNYRDKLVNQVASAIATTLQTGSFPTSMSITRILETFEMSAENCIRLLEHVSLLSAKHVIQNNNHTIYYEIIVYVLNRLAVLKRPISKGSLVIGIGSIYVDLITTLKTEASLEQLEEAFCNFLTISHQCISEIPKDVFHAIFQTVRNTKSAIKFAALLLERRNDLTQEFFSILPENLSKKELIYPLLNIVVKKSIELPAKLLDGIYKEYKNGIMKTIEKPQKAAVIYRENVDISIYLIEKCMTSTDFHRKTLKTDAAEVFQFQLIEAIFKKELRHYADNSDAQRAVYISFLSNVLNLLSVAVKRDKVEKEKILAFSYSIYKWIETYSALNADGDYDSITSSQTWQSFCKICLKLGMRAIEENDQTIAGSEDDANSELLKLMAYLFNKFYVQNSIDSHAALYYEMIMSHSRFFDILLTQNVTQVKTQLMHLMLVLAQTNLTVMDEKHLPILLGAYHGRLSNCDRYILALLQLYEQSGVDCTKYRPFLWGEQAIDHYSLKSIEEKQITQYDVSITQIMMAIDRHISDFTVTNFPIWRHLYTLNQLPEVVFVNPYRSWRGYGRSELEMKIESGDGNFDPSFLKLYPTNSAIHDECYDPAFILPLMCMSLAPGVYLHPLRPIQNGLLGIAFAALSSLDKDTRLAAGLVHQRYREHFENNKFLDKPLWNQAYDNIQNGLEQLRERWSKHKKTKIPRVPYVSGLFLAVSMTTLADPLDPMYKVLSMYLRVKNTFDFLCVPEFNVLFHSPEIDHATFRQFIVNIIRNGVKCSSDLFLLVIRGTFKALMGFYNCTMSNLDINLRILAVINVCVKIPGSVKLMIDHVGVIPWLNVVIDSTEYFYFDTIEAIISIVSNLWYAVRAVEKSSIHLVYTELRLYQLLVKLTPIISSRLSIGSFTQFINILAKTANGKHRDISSDMLDHILSCSRRHFAKHLWYIENLQQFGTSCLESDESYCNGLKQAKLDDMSVLGLVSLRKFVKIWKDLEPSRVENGPEITAH